MPHKRRRRHQHRPLIFSPFGRSIALAACRNKVKCGMQTDPEQKDFPSSSGDEFVNQNSKDKSEQTDSSDDENFQVKGVVQADFAFFDPKPSDFHGVKVLLQTYADNEQWDVSGFVDLILGQPTVGTVVKIENDEDEGVYSFVTALNLGRYKDKKCMIELKDYLLKVCDGTETLAKLRSFTEEHAQDVGLLVSQRVVNLPPQLLPPLYDALFDEVSWAVEDEPTEELRNSFRFKFYLIISKVYKRKSTGPKKRPHRSGNEDTTYIKVEDEIFHKLSSWSFTFPLRVQPVSTDELKGYQLMGLVMAVEASKVSTFREQLHSMIDE